MSQMYLVDDLINRIDNKSLISEFESAKPNFLSQKSGEGHFGVTNPSSDEVIAFVPNMGVADVRSLVAKAAIAQKVWAAKDAKHRSMVLQNLFELVRENRDDLARVLTLEMGKPLTESLGEIDYGASYIQWFAEEAKRIYGDILPGPTSDKRLMVSKSPVGVVAAITPWNFPNAMLARKIAPALAAGCAVVAKPSELTPLSAIILSKLAIEAGLEKDLFSIITSLNSAQVGEELCSNESVRKITFTGSTAVGKQLIRQSAQNVQRTSMELGGNAPFIVFEDADIDAAVEGAIAAKYRNNGQTCVCANRIFVHDAIYDSFAERFINRSKKLVVGDGFIQGVDIGPLINKKALHKVKELINDAVAQGGAIRLGGKEHSLGRSFFEPTVITDVNKKMKLVEEEIFGPVAPLVRFEDDAEVIEMANSTQYGLASYFYTKDVARVWRVAEALDFGMVGINTGVISSEFMPFGGVKQSGMGREGSKYGIEDYVEIKGICVGGI